MAGTENDVEAQVHGACGTTTVELTRAAPAPSIPITLIRPPVVVLLNSLSYVGPMPSIGVAYVAAVLRDAGHDITVIDAPGERLDQLHDFPSPSGMMRRIGLAPDEVIDRIPEGTRIIGITHMFLHEWPQVRAIAEAARARFPDALIMLGGENASSFTQWIFEETDAIDCCVRGEGEATAAELAARVAAGASLEGMAGVAFRPGYLEAEEAPSLPVRLRKLSEVPRPAWDLFPIENYIRYPSTFGVDRGRTIPMLATRGCPYKCTFCSAPQMWTTRYIVREPVDLVDEIEDYVNRYQVDNIDFVDLTAMTKRSWILEFCGELRKRKLDITWQIPVGTRSESIDAEVLQALYDSGCRNITFAPESGSPRMLEIFDKRLDLDHILESIRASNRVGLITHVNTIIGHPKETWHDRWLNLRFLLKAAAAGCDTASTIMFHPYPGSQDFHQLVDSGKLVIDHAFVYDGIARGGPSHHSWNPGISSRMLHLTQMASMGAFFILGNILRPRRALHFVRALFGGEENTVYEQGLRSKLRGPMAKRSTATVEEHTPADVEVMASAAQADAELVKASA
jgi:anaerobic magnesium-protoporphyrin IX monomethyl ester cyclase